jgi:K+-sensing histidine kinase KdpD
MELVIDIPEKAKSKSVRVNVDSVERILFNLIDNACKYATPEAEGDRRIHLEADTSGPVARLRVRDHGRGIEQTEVKRLFRPFQKSATEAAHSAPGVGLGLALCRKMSRALGGELRWEPSSRGGASFVLELPAV